MLNQITSLYMAFSEATKANPVLAGAVGLWGLAVLTFFLKEVPKKVYNFTLQQITTSLYIDNAGGWGEEHLFYNFLAWAEDKKGSSLSRTFMAKKVWGVKEVVFGAGNGDHFFIENGKLFWYNKCALDSSGSERQKERLLITTFGRNKKHLKDLIAKFNPVHEPETKLYAYKLNTQSQWARIAELPKRPIESVIVPEDTKNNLLKEITEFYSMRDWYLEKGLGHKLTIMLHGEPGCGKTSLIKTLAGHFNSELYILNITALNDGMLEQVLAAVPNGSFVVFEDIDSSSAVKKRDKNKPRSDMMEGLGLSLTGVLNTLDGAIPLDNMIVFMTTNCLDQIDDAVLRKGRTDYTVKLEKLGNEEIKQFVKYHYKQELTLDCKPISGCNLQSIVLANKVDFEGFMLDLLDYQEDKEN